MDQNKAQLIVVLDRSGSMEKIKRATIDGFNEFINGQKALPGKADLYVHFFDDQHEVLYDGPLAKAPLLTESTFVPRGMTALFDAVGISLTKIGERLAALPEEKRPARVAVSIITDGLENRSTEWSGDAIRERVEEQKSKYSWQFMFLGANQDAILQGGRLGVDPHASLSYATSERGTRSAYASLSHMNRSVRMGVTASVSKEDREKAMR